MKMATSDTKRRVWLRPFVVSAMLALAVACTGSGPSGGKQKVGLNTNQPFTGETASKCESSSDCGCGRYCDEQGECATGCTKDGDCCASDGAQRCDASDTCGCDSTGQSCTSGQTCVSSVCQCRPDCNGKSQCADDGCGGVCGPPCSSGGCYEGACNPQYCPSGTCNCQTNPGCGCPSGTCSADGCSCEQTPGSCPGFGASSSCQSSCGCGLCVDWEYNGSFYATFCTYSCSTSSECPGGTCCTPLYDGSRACIDTGVINAGACY